MELRLSEIVTAVLTTLPIMFVDEIVQGCWEGHSSYLAEEWLAIEDPSQYSQPIYKPAWPQYFTVRQVKVLMIGFVSLVARYTVHHFLERVLPTRGQRKSSKELDRQAYEKITDSDPQVEEEIIKRLIAQGKIKRASINWCNILLKWAFYLGIFQAVDGYLWWLGYNIIDGNRLRGALELLNPVTILIATIAASLGTQPGFLLLGLMFVPVKYRLQYLEVSSLVINLVIAVVIYWQMPWFLTTEFGTLSMQGYMQGMTDALNATTTITTTSLRPSPSFEVEL